MISIDVHAGPAGIKMCTVHEGSVSHVLNIETQDGFVGIYGTSQDLLHIADAIYSRLGPSAEVMQEAEDTYEMLAIRSAA
jgi:hypothetical protein